MPISTGVTSFSGSATGLTPSTPRTGAVALAGTLIAGNGGTGITAVGASGNILTSNGSAWTSATPAGGGASISNDTSTANDIFPLFASATSGVPTTIFTSNARLLYKPSTGDLQSSQMIALNGLMLNATTVATSYTIASGYNAMSVGPVTISSGIVVTVSSGQRWLVL